MTLGQLYKLELPRQGFLLFLCHPVEVLVKEVLDIYVLHMHKLALAGWFGEHFASEEDVGFLELAGK